MIQLITQFKNNRDDIERKKKKRKDMEKRRGGVEEILYINYNKHK